MLLAAPALAGDRALLNIIGYSEDATKFAFEEYGVQDGSGFAYSSIYVVDLVADKWMYGSPFHVQADDETYDRPLADVRAEAMSRARDKLSEAGISVPGEIYALIGDGVPDNDGKALQFAEPLCCGPGQVQEPVYTLSLETFPVMPTEEYCADMNPVGYALSFSDGEATVELHRDGKTLPKSRGCTLDYRLYAVIEPFERTDGRVAIVSSYPFGFEGPDRRFLAVPIDR
jgi:predicted secreted protein